MLRQPPVPISVVLARGDQVVRPSDVVDLSPAPEIQVVHVDADHGKAFDRPEQLAGVLLAPKGDADPDWLRSTRG